MYDGFRMKGMARTEREKTEPLDYTLRGVFGASLEGISVIFDAADVSRPPEERRQKDEQ